MKFFPFRQKTNNLIPNSIFHLSYDKYFKKYILKLSHLKKIKLNFKYKYIRIC